MTDLTSKMPPIDNTPEIYTGSFELQYCVHTNNKIPVCEYKSTKTGLSVFIAQVDGPVFDGYFCLATEAFDDDGLPHTLEHLIFLGSENYPYKGVLDLLANRCLASGTNAWTDVDHTCYTMETVGSEGFMALLPIFLEHILYPVLSDEGFITEVHHITGKGDDAGVVYCEMQGRENSAESRLYLNMARAMYPKPSGYSSETGGIMSNLRESTTNEKVKNYHRQFYRPENLKIVVIGQVKHDKLFRALNVIEEKILLKEKQSPFERPWQNPVPPLQESKDLIVKYPTDEENNGIFSIAWRGPSASNQYLLTALSLFLKYMTEYSTCVLPKTFIEIDDPFASKICHSFSENLETCIYLMFQNVPLNKLAEIKPKLQDLFGKIVETEDINMERLQTIIKRNKLEYLSNMENSPHQTIIFMIIGHILYGNDQKDLQQRINPIPDMNKLLQEPKSFWISLIKTYFIENKYIAIQCVPSKEEQVKLANEENERVKKQIEKLGETGLNEASENLEKAIKYNNREPPLEMLTSISVPNLNSVNFHNIIKYNTNSDVKDKVDLSNTPVFTYFDHIKSEFVYIYTLLDTTELNSELRIYLPLFLESLFDLPIRKNNKIVNYEDVIEQLNNDTLNYGSSTGLGSYSSRFKCGPYSQTVCVMLQVEAANWQKGINWMTDVLFNTIFTIDRLKIIAAKMNNSIAQAKRNGRDIVMYAMKALRYNNDCNLINNGILKQNRFLSDLLENLNEEIVNKCEEIRRVLTQPKNIVLRLFGNLENVSGVEEVLQGFLPKDVCPQRTSLNATPEDMLKNPRSINGCIIGMGCLESSFFQQTINCINNYEDDDLPSLMLFLQYINQAEGPMWRQIRGKGYSYSYNIDVKPNEGLLYLIFYKATNVIGAYVETKNIIMEQITEKKWNENLIETAKSSLIFQLIEKEKTIGDVVNLSLISDFQKVDFQYNRKLLNYIYKVTIEDLNRVGEKYLLDLFDPKKVKTAIVTTSTKIHEMQEEFNKFDINLNVYCSLEESFLNKL